jgi:HEAT repeat protein
MCLVTSADADQEEKGDVSLMRLVERLESDDATIRKEAAKILEQRSAEADAGMGGLSGLSGADDIATMEQFRNEAKPLVSLLVKLLLSPHEESHVTAARMLGSIGPDAEACGPVLRRIIRDGKNSRGFRLVAAPALLRVLRANETAGREFFEDFYIACCGDADNLKPSGEVESSLVDDEAFAGLYGSLLAAMLIGADRSSIDADSLMQVTSGAFPKRLRLTAIAALAILEAEARRVVPSLVKLLGDDDSVVRKFAGLALLHIEGDPAEIPTIAKAMSLGEAENAEFLDEADDVIERKKDAFKRTLENYAENVALAISMLKHRNSFRQRQAIRMLEDIGPPAREAVPALKNLLNSGDKYTRDAAAEALKKIQDTAARAPNARSNANGE